jgi:bla regulator protein blaR1
MGKIILKIVSWRCTEMNFVSGFLSVALCVSSLSCSSTNPISYAAHLYSTGRTEADNLEILNFFLPEGSELENANGHKTIVSKDLDGDGKNEILGVYRYKDIKNALFLLVLKNVDNRWEKVGTVKGDGYALDVLSFADIDGDGNSDIIFGVKLGSSYSKLNIYLLKERILTKAFSKTYSKLEILDCINSSSKAKKAALAMWVKDTGDAYKIQVVRWNGMELVPAKDLYRSYYSKVVQYYSEKVKEMPEAAFYWYYLADAQGKAGFKKEALKSIAKGISLNKDYPTKQQFEELKRSVM